MNMTVSQSNDTAMEMYGSVKEEDTEAVAVVEAMLNIT